MTLNKTLGLYKSIFHNTLMADPFAAEPRVKLQQGDLFELHLGTYEGPLDMLLELARTQKVDLAQISILQLAEQYLKFIETARDLQLDLAADYLVMAAWLVYLKSRLLLPKDEKKGDEPSAAQLADALAWQLKRLEAMQLNAEAIWRLPQLGQQRFRRGNPEGFSIKNRPQFTDTLYDVLAAYGSIQRAQEKRTYQPSQQFQLVTLDEALERIGAMFDRDDLWRSHAWVDLQQLLQDFTTQHADPITVRSVVAASFSAILEMVKAGTLDLQQAENYDPLYIRAKPPAEWLH